MKCSQCAIEIENQYCSRCGQRWTGKPTTLIGLVLETFQVLFSLERSVFATFLKVIYQPREVVDNYSKGFRRRYSSPGKVAFYTVTMLALHLAFVQDEVLGLNVTFNEGNHYTHLAFLTFFGLFMFLVSGLYFRLKEKISWTKTFLASVYIMCTLLLVFQLLQDIIALCGVQAGSLQTFYFSFSFIYLSIVLTKDAVLKWIILNSLFQILIFMGLLITAVLLITHFNPSDGIKLSY